MKIFCAVLVVLVSVGAIPAAPGSDGKYSAYRKTQAQGKYIHKQPGLYVPMNDRAYYHVHDMRELGRYIHIPYPYDGGYGPYFGMNLPYMHLEPKGDFSWKKYDTVSSPSENHPFNTQEFEIPKPSIMLTYGFPELKHEFEIPKPELPLTYGFPELKQEFEIRKPELPLTYGFPEKQEFVIPEPEISLRYGFPEISSRYSIENDYQPELPSSESKTEIAIETETEGSSTQSVEAFGTGGCRGEAQVTEAPEKSKTEDLIPDLAFEPELQTATELESESYETETPETQT